jgi:hypothetical protein
MMLNVRKQLLDALAAAVPFPKRLGPLREVLDVEAANLVRSLGSEQQFRTAVARFAALGASVYDLLEGFNLEESEHGTATAALF